jgi:hypothetical protein
VRFEFLTTLNIFVTDIRDAKLFARYVPEETFCLYVQGSVVKLQPSRSSGTLSHIYQSVGRLNPEAPKLSADVPASLAFVDSYFKVSRISGVAPRIKTHHSDPSVDRSIKVCSTTRTDLPVLPRDVQGVEGKKGTVRITVFLQK